MNREKAIEILKDLLDCSYVDSFDDDENEALKFAIDTLEQATNALEEKHPDWLPQYEGKWVKANSIIKDMENNSIKMVTNAEEAEEYQISEDISKGFEEFTKMMFKQGQAESEVEEYDIYGDTE